MRRAPGAPDFRQSGFPPADPSCTSPAVQAKSPSSLPSRSCSERFAPQAGEAVGPGIVETSAPDRRERTGIANRVPNSRSRAIGFQSNAPPRVAQQGPGVPGHQSEARPEACPATRRPLRPLHPSLWVERRGQAGLPGHCEPHTRVGVEVPAYSGCRAQELLYSAGGPTHGLPLLRFATTGLLPWAALSSMQITQICVRLS